jgi:uncharacterized protein YybS (DUF2232 family)
MGDPSCCPLPFPWLCSPLCPMPSNDLPTPENAANIPASELHSSKNWADPDTQDPETPDPKPEVEGRGEASGRSPQPSQLDTLYVPQVSTPKAPVSLVETAFLASTGSLLWLVSYYLSLSPWMRILFPIPIALVYLRWGQRSAWMATIVTGLLLSVLMGPYISLLFLIPYGLLGVQLGALWKRGTSWYLSIGIGAILATLSFFFRVWLLSVFLSQDVWEYLNNRIADFLEWGLTLLVNWGILGIELLGRPDINVLQLITLVALLLSDVVYLFTVHLGAWILLEKLGNPIPEPPEWVQVLLEED